MEKNLHSPDQAGLSKAEVIAKYFQKYSEFPVEKLKVVWLNTFNKYGLIGGDSIKLTDGFYISYAVLKETQTQGLKGSAAAVYCAAKMVFGEELKLIKE